MRLTCPACGAMCSLEAWASDAEARQVVKIACELPAEIGGVGLQYVSLFRTGHGRARTNTDRHGRGAG